MSASLNNALQTPLRLDSCSVYSAENFDGKARSSFLFEVCEHGLRVLYRSIILPVVLYGCETWSLTLRDERRLRVFESRVLSRVFGPKRDEVTG